MHLADPKHHPCQQLWPRGSMRQRYRHGPFLLPMVQWGKYGLHFGKQIPSCTPFEFCVSVTCADRTVVSATQTYTVVDNTPPTALCLGVGVDLDANCTATITPGLIDGGSTDNCLISP